MRQAVLVCALAAAWIVLLLSAVAPRAFANEPRTVPVAESVLREAARKRYSPEELGRFDGRDSSLPILMAVRGLVFDVSTGREFYATGARYHAFSGRDLTRAVARMSLAPSDLTDDCSSLTEDEWSFLARVLRETYLARYPVVGHLAGGAFYPKGLCCRDTACGSC